MSVWEVGGGDVEQAGAAQGLGVVDASVLGVGAQGGEDGQECGALEPLAAAVGDAPRCGSMSRSGV